LVLKSAFKKKESRTSEGGASKKKKKKKGEEEEKLKEPAKIKRGKRDSLRKRVKGQKNLRETETHWRDILSFLGEGKGI